MVSLAYWAKNKDEIGEKGKTLQQLQEFLMDKKRAGVQLLNKDCYNDKLLLVTGSQVPEPGDQDDDDSCELTVNCLNFPFNCCK